MDRHQVGQLASGKLRETGGSVRVQQQFDAS